MIKKREKLKLYLDRALLVLVIAFLVSFAGWMIFYADWQVTRGSSVQERPLVKEVR